MNGWTFTWQGGRQLAAMSNGTTTLSFAYNDSGLRTSKTVGSVTHNYTYQGSTLVADVTATDALYFHYDQNGSILGFTFKTGSTTSEYYYVKNLQGDVIGILDASGNLVASYTYDAWGSVLTATGTNSALANRNPIRYRGYNYDPETELYYLQSRYYDPEVGRFINADAYTQTYNNAIGANMYAYCANNPVYMSDDGGEAAHIAIGAAIGAVLGGFSAYMSGDSVLVGVVCGAASGAAMTFFGPSIVLGASIAGAGNIVSQVANHYIDNSEPGNRSFYDAMENFEFNTSSFVVDTVAGGFFSGVSKLSGDMLEGAFKGLNSSEDKFIFKIISHCYDGVNTLFEFAVTEGAHAVFGG